MNSIILISLLALVSGSSASSLKANGDFSPKTNLNTSEFENEIIIENVHIQGRNIKGRSLSSRGEKAIKEFLSQMPIGFPELGLPALAPYVKEEFEYQIKQSFAEINVNFENIQIEGLDNLLINHFEISYVFSQNIKYNFTFPRIVASGKYSSDSIIDLIKEFGISVNHYGKGNFEIELENITFEGYFKYTMPFVHGSISIYNFEGSVELGNLLTNIGGLAGRSTLTQAINDELEEFGMKFVRSNQELINNVIQDVLIPLANKKLDGKKVWWLIG